MVPLIGCSLVLATAALVAAKTVLFRVRYGRGVLFARVPDDPLYFPLGVALLAALFMPKLGAAEDHCLLAVVAALFVFACALRFEPRDR